jgi:hypothetical protein
MPMDTIKKLDYQKTMIVMFGLICPVGFFCHFYQILTDTYVKIAQTFDWLKHFFNSLSELLHANSSDLPEIFLLFHFGVNLKFKMTDLASDWLRH